jgi:hypothetical protein
MRQPSGIRHGLRAARRSCVTSPGSWGRSKSSSSSTSRCIPSPIAEAAVARFKAEALIKLTERTYRQEYVLFLRAEGGKIAFLREYFDPTAAAKAMDAPILGLDGK